MSNHLKIIHFVPSVIALFVANLVYGSVSIPIDEVFHVLLGEHASKTSWEFIVLQSRLPQALTAMMCGASLSASGLLL